MFTAHCVTNPSSKNLKQGVITSPRPLVEVSCLIFEYSISALLQLTPLLTLLFIVPIVNNTPLVFQATLFR